MSIQVQLTVNRGTTHCQLEIISQCFLSVTYLCWLYVDIMYCKHTFMTFLLKYVPSGTLSKSVCIFIHLVERALILDL